MRERHWYGAVVVFSSALVALYSIEALLTFASPSWIDRLGTTLRRGPSVIAETIRVRRMGIDAYPFLQTDTFLDSAGNATGLSQNVLPLSGIPGAMTILCHEADATIGYRADSLGFRNSNDAWNAADLSAVLVGDSFAHGFCRPDSETIPAILLRDGYYVATLGLTGAGPLSELGIIREYVTSMRPRVVYWMFYEGNDLIDLDTERKSLLRNYLASNFSQDLLHKRTAIAAAETRFTDSVITSYKGPTLQSRLIGFLTLRQLRTATGLYRNPIQTPLRDESGELALLEKVLRVAQSDVSAWKGQLVLVYLPERRRFNSASRAVTGENHDPRDVQASVRAIAKALGIPVLDAADAFGAERDPSSLWNARRYHYNALGYGVVGNLIERDLRARVSRE